MKKQVSQKIDQLMQVDQDLIDLITLLFLQRDFIDYVFEDIWEQLRFSKKFT